MKFLIAALSIATAGCSLTIKDVPIKIGDTEVPSGLQCEEDEVIAFVQEGEAPYDLGCVHPDNLYLDERTERVSR